MSLLLTPIGLLALGFYLYGVAISAKAEAKADSDFFTVLIKAATWPVTIFHSLEKLRRHRPLN